MYLREHDVTSEPDGIFGGRLSGPDEAEDTRIKLQAKLAEISCLGRIENCIIEFIFNLRHPERRRTPLPPLKSASAGERLLIQERMHIRDVVRSWLQAEIRGLQFDAKKTNEMFCRSITTDLQDLESALRCLSDPKKCNMGQDDIVRYRGWVGRLVGDLTVPFKIFSTIGCTAPDLSSTETKVQNMMWPKDQAMQDQRSKLIEAIRKAR